MSDFVPMAAIGVGAYLLWFGVHYWRDTSHYPHHVIKSVVSGGGLPPRAEAASSSAGDAAQLAADVTAAVTDTGPTSGSGSASTSGTTINISAINTSDLSAIPAQTAIGTGTNAQNWAGAILTAMGAPVNQANVASMVSWFGAEDNHGAAGAGASGVGENNPLDLTPSSGNFTGTTGTEPSGAGAGHPGNYNFATPADGIAATAQEINAYGNIAAALKSGKGLIGNSAVSSQLSNWSGGGYSSLS